MKDELVEQPADGVGPWIALTIIAVASTALLTLGALLLFWGVDSLSDGFVAAAVLGAGAGGATYATRRVASVAAARARAQVVGIELLSLAGEPGAEPPFHTERAVRALEHAEYLVDELVAVGAGSSAARLRRQAVDTALRLGVDIFSFKPQRHDQVDPTHVYKPLSTSGSDHESE